ncbi:proton-conducting transporter membrane subunit [Marinilabiliaceae bacterium ANBcel2]|nr:proton-conducting transporter membrane subunit [Marinilabiliaceae bacterium ANBcel2]
MANLLTVLIASLFLATLAIPVIYRLRTNGTGTFLALFPLLIFILLGYLLITLNPFEAGIGDSSIAILEGMELSLRVDGLSLIFGLLISGIGFLILLYSSFYMANQERQKSFYLYLMIFMGAMLALVFSNNLITLFIFWEITSVASFFLIGYNHHREKSRQAAFQALIITAVGGLALLFAVILTGNITGTYRISEIISEGIHLGNHSRYPLILSLVIIAAVTKSAQFPFHFWLPGAMQAPTPISAYLHSATMVNAGIFLLLRLYPLLGGTIMWKYSLLITGSITMFLGAFSSMGQKDLKRILAFTTISALGTMMLLIGIDTVNSIKAALVFFIVHGLYKGGLFMITGIIDKSTGTRDIYQLNNLTKSMPFTALFTFLAVISMAGLPPMLGFIGKELIYEATIQMPQLSWIIVPLGVGANIIMVAISITVFYELFIYQKKKITTKLLIKEKAFPTSFLVGPAILAFMGLLLGIAPEILENAISNSIYFIRGQSIKITLSLWHGFNEVLLLSILTIAGGVILFLLRKPANRFIAHILNLFDIYHLPSIFNNLVNTYLKVTSRNTERIQHGYHRFYLMTFFLVTIAITSLHLFKITDIPFSLQYFSPVKPHVLLLIIIASIAVLFAVFTKTRLSAILAMGLTGYSIGLIYLFYGAVDLAITQFLAETIIMVIFVMVIYYLPTFAVLSTRTSRIRDAIISIITGLFITLVILKAELIKPDYRVSDFFTENSYTLGEGKNIVNTILVDFRALDTLGEMFVITMAAAGVFSLFKFQIKRLKERKKDS